MSNVFVFPIVSGSVGRVTVNREAIWPAFCINFELIEVASANVYTKRGFDCVDEDLDNFLRNNEVQGSEIMHVKAWIRDQMHDSSIHTAIPGS